MNGLEINNLTQRTQSNLQRGAEFITKAHEIFVYCVSMSFNDVLKKEFDAKACVEVCDPLKFIQRWQKALPPEALVTSGAVGDYPKYVCRMVRYYHAHDEAAKAAMKNVKLKPVGMTPAVATLEVPTPDERPITVSVEPQPDEIVSRILEILELRVGRGRRGLAVAWHSVAAGPGCFRTRSRAQRSLATDPATRADLEWPRLDFLCPRRVSI